MTGRICCRIVSVCMFVMAGWLFAEDRLGRPLLFDDGPDSTSLTTSLVMMLLGLWGWLGGEFCALRERVERLECSAQAPAVEAHDRTD